MHHSQIYTKHPVCPKHLNLTSPEKKRDDQKDFVTLCRFINEIEKFKGGSHQLPQLINSIQIACKTVALTLRKSGVAQIQSLGLSKQLNLIEIKRLEKYFNEVFINLLTNTYAVCLIGCNDCDEVIRVDAERAGKYIVIFKASDASMNVDASLCLGTTFIVLKKKGATRIEERDLLQPGQKIIAAGYTLYGFSTEMVIAVEGNVVSGFTLDNSIGEFILTSENIEIPKMGKSYCADEGFAHSWDPNLVNYLNKKKSEKAGSLAWSARYTGSFVADAHRTLMFGGMFISPPIKDYPKGKSKLMFDCNPIAFIMTQAGGYASNGKVLIGEIVPEKLHERSPIYCGSPDDVKELVKSLKQF
ncbi:fructose-1,6-bisphosphatase 1-like [Cimex lectularius]|uniref:fructose-bisphosphatase n=1 Tax=Cimex lectularius TaxID=79782 RepID=A0A8I6RUY6_CIMLE|nr:fructose-1,6-bisphosphatase 1-like [Cimex lectularius]